MRFIFLQLLALIFALPPAQAQSVTDNLPPLIIEGQPSTEAPVVKEVPTAPPASAVSELYTVTDVNADVTSDTAGHARDQALMQAQRAAYGQLCVRLGVPDNSAKLSDDALASLVQSFEVQSERVSAVRYIGIYTIRFKPSAVQKKTGTFVTPEGAGALPQGPFAHVTMAVQTESLAGWAQTRKRLSKVPQVAKIDMVSLGRGVSQIDVSHSGSLDDLIQGLMAQGFVLRRNSYGTWELGENGTVP